MVPLEKLSHAPLLCSGVFDLYLNIFCKFISIAILLVATNKIAIFDKNCYIFSGLKILIGFYDMIRKVKKYLLLEKKYIFKVRSDTGWFIQRN